MCVVSMVVDHYYDKWNPHRIIPIVYPTIPNKADIDEFYRLLKRARKYDKENNQVDCENEQKKQQLRDLADSFGIKINFE